MSESGELNFALVRLGETTLAIESKYIVEATAQLESLKTWTHTNSGAEQVFYLRGTVVPLADLGCLTELGELRERKNRENQCVVILRNGHVCLGLKIDELIGLRRFSQDDQIKLKHEPSTDTLFTSVIQFHTDTKVSPELISVLDVPAFFQRSGTWSEASLGLEKEANSSVEDVRKSHFALVEIRGHLVLVESKFIMSTQRLALLQQTGSSDSEVLGIARFRDQNIQISQLVALDGIQSVGAEPLVCVLQANASWGGIVIDCVRKTLWLDVEQILPLSSTGMSRDDGFKGIAYDESGIPMLLLDCEYVLSRSAQLPNNRNISESLQISQDDYASQNTDVESVLLESYVAFRAGGQRAICLNSIESIVNYPSRINLASKRHPAFVGSFYWRDKGVALWDLSLLAGSKPTSIDDETKVLIVAQDGALIALICERLLMLLPSRQIEVLQIRNELGRVMELISHREDGGIRKTYAKFDTKHYKELVES